MPGRFVGILGLTIFCLSGMALAQSAASGPVVIYETGFEANDGFDDSQTLAGQGGWVSINAGGNGLVDDFFEGLGQQAFIGFTPPAEPNEPLFVFRPLDYVLDPDREPVIRFTVVMAIIDSSNGQYDDFRWSVYTIAGERLFTLNFDNDAMLITYALDDGAGFVSTATAFSHASLMDLVITMNIARNHWTAALNNMVVVNAQPITTRGVLTDIGDIDAVWVIADPSAPGDNFMLFDNYRVEADEVEAIAPTLEWGGRLPDGRVLVRIFGEPNRSYAVEGSFDLVNWTVLRTASASDGVFDFADSEAIGLMRRFYRARLVN